MWLLDQSLQIPAIGETLKKTYMFSSEKTEGEHCDYFQII